jgi:hypothetical protein
MQWLWNLNLIHFFNFYLGIAFLASTYVRVSQYRAILSLVRSIPGRWPKLFQLITRHSHLFLTWATILPAALAFAVFAMNMLASRLIWPQVDLTLAELLERWAVLPVILPLGLFMVLIDGYATFSVGEVDRQMMQQYFDQAEYWLRSWTAPVVRIFTFGYVNPRQMVAVEVRNALLEASRLINSTLWWVTAQVSLRIAFGLSLWLTYAWIQHS